jgi:hypothetical protein
MRTKAALSASLAALVLAVAAALPRSGAAPEEAAGRAAAPVPAAPPADPWAAPARLPPPVLYFDRWETLTTKDGLPSDRTTCVTVEGDDLYVGTESGLAMRRGGKWTVVGKAEGLPHRFVTSVARDRAADVTWASTIKGLVRIAGGRVETYSQKSSGLASDIVYHAAVDGPRVWCATGAGVSVLDTRTGSWSLFDNENSIMNEPWCYAVAFGPERAWFGVWAGGIVELNRRDATWRDYQDTDGELEVDLLRDDGPIHMVSSFASWADGLLWQSTYFGVSSFDGHRWTSWTAKDGGLPGDFVVHVAGRGHTGYLATDQGLGVVSRDDGRVVSYRRQPDGTCRVRTVTNFLETDVRTCASAPASDVCNWTFPVEDGIWVATSAGLSRGYAAKEKP